MEPSNNPRLAGINDRLKEIKQSLEKRYKELAITRGVKSQADTIRTMIDRLEGEQLELEAEQKQLRQSQEIQVKQ